MFLSPISWRPLWSLNPKSECRQWYPNRRGETFLYITKVTICTKGREVESQSGNSAAICTSHHWPEFSASLNSFRSSGPNLCGCLSAYLCPMSYCHFCPVLYSRRFLLTFNCSCSTSVIIFKSLPFPNYFWGPTEVASWIPDTLPSGFLYGTCLILPRLLGNFC